jgi:hypothetical protein
MIPSPNRLHFGGSCAPTVSAAQAHFKAASRCLRQMAKTPPQGDREAQQRYRQRLIQHNLSDSQIDKMQV